MQLKLLKTKIDTSMKFRLKSAVMLTTVVSSALFASCSGKGNGSNTPGPKPEPATLTAPDNLRALNITTTSATLSWDAVLEADSYVVRFNDKTIPVDETTYELTELTPGTEYIWEVASVRDDEHSTWAESSFITAEEPRTPLVVGNGAYYGQIYEGVRLEVFNLLFLGFDPATKDYNGHELLLELLVDPALVDPTAESFDIPAGTYEFSTSYAANTVNLLSRYTTLSLIVDGMYGADYTVMGGTLTVEGDRNNYKMTMDVECMGGGVFRGIYEGPFSVVSAPSNTFEMGELGFVTDIKYFADARPGYSVDAYMFHAANSGVSLSPENQWVGSGWALFSAQFHTALGSNGTIIPDGTYNVSSSWAPGTVLAGYSTSSGRHGLWAYDLEGGSIQRRFAITGGTVTSTYANGSYTMVLDGTDDDGYIFTATVKGVPATNSGTQAGAGGLGTRLWTPAALSAFGR